MGSAKWLKTQEGQGSGLQMVHPGAGKGTHGKGRSGHGQRGAEEKLPLWSTHPQGSAQGGAAPAGEPKKHQPKRFQHVPRDRVSQASETRGEGRTTPRPHSRAPWPNLLLAHQTYVVKEGQEPVRQLQSDGASHLPIC